MSNDVGCSKMPLFSRFFGASEGVHIQEVTGSSPVVPTSIAKGTANAVPFAMLREHPPAKTSRASETCGRGACSHPVVRERVPSRAGSAACVVSLKRNLRHLQDAFAVRRMTCCPHQKTHCLVGFFIPRKSFTL